MQNSNSIAKSSSDVKQDPK